MTLEEKLELAEKKIRYADDYREIYNLVSLQTLYLRVQKHQDALEACWSKREDIRFGTARGRQAVIDFLVKEPTERNEKKLKIANQFYGVALSPENNGVGDMESIAVASPYIIIADDRKTAQGIWFTPEVKAELDSSGRLYGRYIQQKIGVDFILEDNEWKIWHYNIYPDFTCTLPSEIFDDSRYTGRTFQVEDMPEGRPDAHGAGAGGPQGGEAPSEEMRKRMEPYSPTKVPYFNPPIPTPYETWSEHETLPLG